MNKEIRKAIQEYIDQIRKEFKIRIAFYEHHRHKTHFVSLIGVNGIHFLKDGKLTDALNCVSQIYTKNKESIHFSRAEEPKTQLIPKSTDTAIEQHVLF